MKLLLLLTTILLTGCEKPVYEAIMKAGIWNLDAMGLDANPGWSN